MGFWQLAACPWIGRQQEASSQGPDTRNLVRDRVFNLLVGRNTRFF